MRAAQLLTVIALGVCALVLGTGFLWFFGVLPGDSESEPSHATSAPTRCDEVLAVGTEKALNNTFELDLKLGDRVCLVNTGSHGFVAYTADDRTPGERLFEMTGSPADSGYVQMGLIPEQ